MRAYTLVLIATLAGTPCYLRGQLPVITNQPVSRVVYAGADVTFTVGLSNPAPLSPYAASPFTYQWFFTPANQTNSVDVSAGATNHCAGALVMPLSLPSQSGLGPAYHNFSYSYPCGLALDAAGDLFISDATDNYAFRSINTITTNSTYAVLAGSGPPLGWALPINALNDDGAGRYASVSKPASVAADAVGNAYIVDTGHSRLRKVDTNGIITTIAGGGVGDFGPATNAILYVPEGLTVDKTGNLFVADWENNRVRKIDTNGVITTVLGDGWWSMSSPGVAVFDYYHPQAVTADAAGNVFVAVTGNHSIVKLSTSGTITTLVYDNYPIRYPPGTIGDGGPAIMAALNDPTGIAVDSLGNVFIADAGWGTVRKINTNGIITTVAGGGTNGLPGWPIGSPFYTGPSSGDNGDGGLAKNAFIQLTTVAVDPAGNVLIPDSQFNSIRKVDTNGIITTVAGGGTNDPGEGMLSTNVALYAGNVVADASGNLFFMDEKHFTIRKVGTNGIVTTVAGNGTQGYSGDGGPATNASLSDACGSSSVTVDSLGNLFISDSSNYRIRKVDTNGIITTVAGVNPFSTNCGASSTYSVDSGPQLNVFYGDGGLAASACLNNPTDVALDRSGNIFIADTGSYRIRKVDTNNIITTFAGNGTNNFYQDGLAATTVSVNPAGLTVDPAGDVLISDSQLQRVLKVDAHGMVNTFAGNGVAVSSGDGGPARDAGLSPTAMASDAAGNIFIADNDVIREVLTNGIITTALGTNMSIPVSLGLPASFPLQHVNHMALDGSGNLFVSTVSSNNSIVQFFEAFPMQNPRQESVLTVTNVTVANAGLYGAMVKNFPYSVSIQPVNLTVVTNPAIYRTTWNTEGCMTLDFVSPPGSTNEVLFATNLMPPVVWTSISTNVAGPDGDWQFTDHAAAGLPTRYYRFRPH